MKKYTKFDNYSDCIEYLFELERVGIKYDLINIKKLLRFLENPQNYFQSIHIAGTNGKGSVAAMLNSILIELTHPGQKMRNDRQECLSHQMNNKGKEKPPQPPFTKGEMTTPQPPFTKGEVTQPGQKMRNDRQECLSHRKDIDREFNIGLYTSPHIIDFRERILVNGNYISKRFIIDYVNRIYDFIKNMNISFFEVTTAMAFDYFKHCNVKYAVIEAGLGGRLDSTNILKPVLSVITGISIDHTEYLGDSIENIAKEKAGIIKKNVPCVIGETNKSAIRIFKSNAKERNSKLIFADSKKNIKERKINHKGINFDYENEFLKLKNVQLPLTGDYQLKNIAIALTAITILKTTVDTEHTKDYQEGIKRGLEKVIDNSKIYGRFQVIKDRPKIIIDVSHNPEALRNLRNNLQKYKFRNLFVIFGIMKDKNYKECLRIINDLDGIVILTKPKYKRALEPDVMYDYVTTLEHRNEREEPLEMCNEVVGSLEHRNEKKRGTNSSDDKKQSADEDDGKRGTNSSDDEKQSADEDNEGGGVNEVKNDFNLDKFVVINNIKDSFKYIQKRINKNDLLLVTGSFFVVGEFLKTKGVKKLRS